MHILRAVWVCHVHHSVPGDGGEFQQGVDCIQAQKMHLFGHVRVLADMLMLCCRNINTLYKIVPSCVRAADTFHS